MTKYHWWWIKITFLPVLVFALGQHIFNSGHQNSQTWEYSSEKTRSYLSPFLSEKLDRIPILFMNIVFWVKFRRKPPSRSSSTEKPSRPTMPPVRKVECGASGLSPCLWPPTPTRGLLYPAFSGTLGSSTYPHSPARSYMGRPKWRPEQVFFFYFYFLFSLFLFCFYTNTKMYLYLWNKKTIIKNKIFICK